MRLLISDTNILIDMEAGALVERLFQLPVQFAIPDVLYYEEIAPYGANWMELGLKLMEVSGEFVQYAAQLPIKYNQLLLHKSALKPSHNDYLALALAKQHQCTLLTGDRSLRAVALQEQVSVMGSIGLLCTLVEHNIISVKAAFDALARMKVAKRWLPWAEAEKALAALR
jgi:predicted nucleic acid-binding protein